MGKLGDVHRVFARGAGALLTSVEGKSTRFRRQGRGVCRLSEGSVAATSSAVSAVAAASAGVAITSAAPVAAVALRRALALASAVVTVAVGDEDDQTTDQQ